MYPADMVLGWVTSSGQAHVAAYQVNSYDMTDRDKVCATRPTRPYCHVTHMQSRQACVVHRSHAFR